MFYFYSRKQPFNEIVLLTFKLFANEIQDFTSGTLYRAIRFVGMRAGGKGAPVEAGSP
jgi:hypothetical protein